jgi:hypothetical protein
MADNVADLTLMHIRRIDQAQHRILEVLERPETRLGRIERDLLDVKRDLGELKSDQILMENRILNGMNRILNFVERMTIEECLRTFGASAKLR